MKPDRLRGWWSGDHRQDHRHAARVALGLLVPGLALVAAGRPELMLFAVFGSFTGMYGRLEAPLERLRHQLHAAGMLVTGVALGITLAVTSAPVAVLVGSVTAFATIGSLLTDRLALRPGGPFFGIFALGATATVGPDLVSTAGAVAICAATAAFSLALSLAASLLRSGPATLREPRPVPARPASLAGSRAQAMRYALATATAGVGGLMLGLEDHANWAMAGAAVPLAVVTTGEPLDLRAVVHRARLRLTGTLVGLAVAAVLLVPGPGATLMALAVMVLLFPTELYMSRHYGIALGFFTPLILCMTELADPTDPIAMLVARGADTLIGVVAGVAAAWLVTGPKQLGAREKEQAWAG